MAEKMRATSRSGDGYWQQREDRQRRNDIRDDKLIGQEMSRIFNRAADNAVKEIESFYGRYADKEGISLADAMRPVTRSEMEEYQRLAKIYVEAAAARRRGEATSVDPFSDEAYRAMRRYNMSMKVNRLEMLKARIGIANVDSYDRMKDIIESGLSRAAQQRYEYYAGILGKTVQNPEQAAQTLVNASYHNATWSERLWKNQDRLRDKLGDALRTGLLQGKGTAVLARDIRNAFGVSTYDAQRLMRTEMARVRIGAAEQSMMANGNTHYMYLAEPSACPDCAALADQVFPLPDMQPGSNAPPLHPFCRCAVAPHWDDDKYQRWLSGPAQAGVPWGEFDILDREMSDSKKSFMGIPLGSSDNTRVIPKSVGARVFKNSIVDFETGMEYHIGGSGRITNVETFAGKGVKEKYYKAYKYSEKYGGLPEEWKHMKGKAYIENEFESGFAEIHWSEHDVYGSYDPFVKKWL